MIDKDIRDLLERGYSVTMYKTRFVELLARHDDTDDNMDYWEVTLIGRLATVKDPRRTRPTPSAWIPLVIPHILTLNERLTS